MSMLVNIQVLCKEHGISVPSLEKELGFGKGSIYKWDKNSPSIDKLQKVADYFEVSVERILYGFELSKFESYVRIIVGQKTIEEVARESGLDVDILDGYMIGVRTQRPSLEFLNKLTDYNPYEVLVDNKSIFEAAGYVPPTSSSDREKHEPKTIAAHHEGEDWTEEETKDLETFKAFLRNRRKQQE